MKSVLLSIKPKYCKLIVDGKKTLEIRKSKPKIETPFKCYIYCPYARELDDILYVGNPIKTNRMYSANGKVMGVFVCDRISKIPYIGLVDFIDCEMSCLTAHEIIAYAKGKLLFGWHISDLVIYDKPKELDEFSKPCSHDCGNCKYWYRGSVVNEEPPYCEWEDYAITHPPQSWCYVEELEGVKNDRA